MSGLRQRAPFYLDEWTPLFLRDFLVVLEKFTWECKRIVAWKSRAQPGSLQKLRQHVKKRGLRRIQPCRGNSMIRHITLLSLLLTPFSPNCCGCSAQSSFFEIDGGTSGVCPHCVANSTGSGPGQGEMPCRHPGCRGQVKNTAMADAPNSALLAEYAGVELSAFPRSDRKLRDSESTLLATKFPQCTSPSFIELCCIVR